MADKKFGVRQIDLIGASGSTNIETPNTLNLKSNQVAISTDLSIGGSVVSHVLVGSGFSVGIGTSVPKSAFEVDGTARATNFIGNGSGLTNITGTGSGIGVSVAGATVGTAQTINFIGAAVTTSEAQSGIVTCTITSGGTLDRNLTVGSFSVTSAGATLSPGGVVAGVATVNNLNATNLNVTGVSTFTADKVFFKNGGTPLPATLQIETGVAGVGNTIRSSNTLDLVTNGSAFKLTLDTTNAIISGGTGAAQYVQLYGTGSEKLKTIGTGVTITGTTFSNQLNVSGISTFVGVTTFSANANVGVDTSVGVIMTAANGTRYRLFVENDGSLSTIALS